VRSGGARCLAAEASSLPPKNEEGSHIVTPTLLSPRYNKILFARRVIV